MKNILIIGSSGMLGFAVSEYFSRKNYNIKLISRKDFDIGTDPFENFIEKLSGVDCVINCAGVIKPQIAKFSIEEVVKVNSIFPKNLAMYCSQKNIYCFHITTDCVYSGKKGNYNETDFFDAEDLYGMSKNAGESNECMVLRTSIIGEENEQSRSLLEWAKSQAGKVVNGFTNHQWNGVTTVYLAEIIDSIIKNNLYKKGIFHIHSQLPVSKYELLNIFNEVYDLKLGINPIEADEVINRSLSSIYELSSKVCIKSIKQQIKEMQKFFKLKEIIQCSNQMN